jgi:hypothetical protein
MRSLFDKIRKHIIIAIYKGAEYLGICFILFILAIMNWIDKN